MERPCGGAFFLAGMGLNGNFKGAHIKINPPILQLFGLVESPRRLARDSETGVVEHNDKLSFGFQMVGCVFKSGLRMLKVLKGQDECCMGEGGVAELKRFCNIRDVEGGFRLFLGALNEGGRDVNADIVNALGKRSGKHPLPAGEV